MPKSVALQDYNLAWHEDFISLCIRLTHIYSPWPESDRKRKASCATRTYETRWGITESPCSATHYWPTIWPAVWTPNAALPQPLSNSRAEHKSHQILHECFLLLAGGLCHIAFIFCPSSTSLSHLRPRCVFITIQSSVLASACPHTIFLSIRSHSSWLHGKRVPARDKLSHTHWRCVTNSSGQPRSLYLWHCALWNMNGQTEMHSFLSFLKLETIRCNSDKMPWLRGKLIIVFSTSNCHTDARVWSMRISTAKPPG